MWQGMAEGEEGGLCFCEASTLCKNYMYTNLT